MPKRKPTDSFFYRRRFLIAYGLLTVSAVYFIIRGLLLVDGVTASEVGSVITATHLAGIGIDMPYHLLQDMSLKIFGLTPFGIKVPSLLLGIMALIGYLLLIGRWTRKSTAIAAALIFGSGVTLRLLSLTGTPAILYVLYPLALLLLGTYLIEKRRSRFIALIVLVATISLALLTPGLAYIIAAGIGISLLSPHIRHGIRRLGPGGIAILVLGTLAALTPVTLSVLSDMSRLSTLLLIPDTFSFSVILENARQLAGSFLGFLNPGLHDGLAVPVLGLAGFGLALIGLGVTATSLYTARSRFLITWLVLAVLMALLSPALVIFVFTVMVLFVGLALDWIARYWYRMFPLNPYARLFGLSLIIVLVGGTVLSSALRFAGTVQYSQASRAVYSQDLNLILSTNSREKNAPMILVVSETDKSFYDALTIKHLNIVVASRLEGAAPKTYTLSSRPIDGRIATEIITDSRSSGADRFYLYR